MGEDGGDAPLYEAGGGEGGDEGAGAGGRVGFCEVVFAFEVLVEVGYVEVGLFVVVAGEDSWGLLGWPGGKGKEGGSPA